MLDLPPLAPAFQSRAAWRCCTARTEPRIGPSLARSHAATATEFGIPSAAIRLITFTAIGLQVHQRCHARQKRRLA